MWSVAFASAPAAEVSHDLGPAVAGRVQQRRHLGVVARVDDGARAQ
jgi:hypothetical protein